VTAIAVMGQVGALITLMLQLRDFRKQTQFSTKATRLVDLRAGVLARVLIFVGYACKVLLFCWLKCTPLGAPSLDFAEGFFELLAVRGQFVFNARRHFLI